MDFPTFVQNVIALFATLAGVTALIIFAVNALKKIGWVKDGSADVWQKGLTLLAFVLLLVQQAYFPQFDVLKLDSIAAALAQLGTLVLPMLVTVAFPVMNQFARYVHKHVAGLPVFGYSFSRAHR